MRTRSEHDRGIWGGAAAGWRGGLGGAVLVAALMAGVNCGADEIGFVERYALAEDREAALAELIAGTEEHAWFWALHHEHLGQWDEQAAVIEAWTARSPGSGLMETFRLRRALLEYGQQPEASLARLREQLGLRFDHQRDQLDGERDLPTELDPALVAWEAYLGAAKQRGALVSGLHDSGLDGLLRGGEELDGLSRRELLSRLRAPDYGALVALVAADLAGEQSGGFGEFAIHWLLLEEQLIELAEQRGEVMREANYVVARLQKMQPWPGSGWQQDLMERLAYLERAWGFVGALDPSLNSFRADILYHILDTRRALGDFDGGVFLDYLKLPRATPYMRAEFLEDPARRGAMVHLGGYDHSAGSGLPSVVNDEELVRDYLLRLIRGGADEAAYAPYLREDYLRAVVAEARLLAGEGDAERWFSALGAAAASELRDRVDLDFDLSNRREYGVDDAVELDVWLKNVGEVLIKVYEINTVGHYREEGEEITTALDLDGLVPNFERKLAVERASPFLRDAERLEFPELKGKRGVWVIELLGGGKSSRALVRKGRLDYLAQTGPAGTALRVYDELGRAVVGASAWISGRQFVAGQDGRIFVPFSTEPGRRRIVLEAGGTASLDWFDHVGEGYGLSAGFAVDREQLLRRERATVVVRPNLTLNGQPVSPGLLEEVSLTLTSTDLDGVESVEKVDGLVVSEMGESSHEFLVPERLVALRFRLEGKVARASVGGKVSLAADGQVQINGIERGGWTRALHLARGAGGYGIELLGKNGEPAAGRAVVMRLFHRDFIEPQHVTLKTDEAGRAGLGELDGIVRVVAGAEGVQEASWELRGDRARRPRVIHARAGEEILVPYLGASDGVERGEVALFDVRSAAETYGSDLLGRIELRDGYYVIGGLAEGDYKLILRGEGSEIWLRVGEGEARDGHLFTARRILQLPRLEPLHIIGAGIDGETLEIRLGRASEATRVHLFAGRFQAERDVHAALGAFSVAVPGAVRPARLESSYLSGRVLGEEFRYILERREGGARRGNLLPRAGLLLNPWAVRETGSDVQVALGGEAYRQQMDGQAGARAPREAEATGDLGESQGHVNLDFLADAAPVLLNLLADDDGIVRVPVAELGGRGQLRIVATDPEQIITREIVVGGGEVGRRDLRLASGLEVDEDYAERDEVTVLATGEAVRIDDLGSARFERLDSLGKVYALYATLGQSEVLREFGFLLQWGELEAERKRELYSEHACHELSFFLSRRDPEFFEQVVLPYLSNKRHKTFLDHYLLGDDLEGYLAPYAFGRLNIVEQILLARRVGGDVQASVARSIDDRHALLPSDPERENFLFESVLASGAMGAADDQILQVLREKSEDKAALDAMEAEGESLGAPQFGAESARRGAGVGDAMSPPAPLAAPAPAAAAGEAAGRLANGLAAAEPDAMSEPVAEMMADQELAEDMSGMERAKDERSDRDAAVADGSERMLRQRKLVEEADGDWAFFAREEAAREKQQMLYRQLTPTMEWAENNYYRLRVEEQGAGLVEVNAFWRDYAMWDGQGGFASAHLAAAAGNFTEMMFALALLDLPEVAGKHEVEVDGASLEIRAGSPIILFLRQIRPAEQAEQEVPLLVSQNFFDVADRYRMEGNEQVDKFVAREFLAGSVYGCQIVVTNPTSSVQRIDVLTQIPGGALPVMGSRETRSQRLRLEPYTTQKLEYHFYFPEVIGEVTHYPVQVTREGQRLAGADAFTQEVVGSLSEIDKASWDYLSQWGEEEEVLAYLAGAPLGRIDLGRVAWRARESEEFYLKLIAQLRERHHYDGLLWSYGLFHDITAIVRDFLLHQDGLIERVGPYLISEILEIDLIERGIYEHLEYSPLVNARAHRLGRSRKILNGEFLGQYHEAMRVLAHKPELASEDHLAAAYYLLLQDRVEEGIAHYAKVEVAGVAERLQHDYLGCYIAFYEGDIDKARQIATRHVGHPVVRWRERFAQVLAQIGEIDGAAVVAEDPEDRERRLEEQAGQAPSFEFEIEGAEVLVRYENLAEVEVNYYEMDLEFLFSSKPFVSGGGGRFSVIKPNRSARVALPAGQKEHRIALPEAYRTANVLVELVGAGRARSVAYFANSLRVVLSEDFGMVQVLGAGDGLPKAKTYVKVYARFTDGTEGFYKDGYTDMRGKFDYATLSTDELSRVERFSILILSEDSGAVVKEADVPVR